MLSLLLPYITFLVCPWRYGSRGSAHTLKLRFKPSILNRHHPRENTRDVFLWDGCLRISPSSLRP